MWDSKPLVHRKPTTLNKSPPRNKIIITSKDPRVHPVVESPVKDAVTAVNVTNHGEDETARDNTNNDAAVGRLRPKTISVNPDELKPTTAPTTPVAVTIESESRLTNFCGNCGTHRRDDNRFCVTCGKDLSL